MVQGPNYQLAMSVSICVWRSCLPWGLIPTQFPDPDLGVYPIGREIPVLQVLFAQDLGIDSDLQQLATPATAWGDTGHHLPAGDAIFEGIFRIVLRQLMCEGIPRLSEFRRQLRYRNAISGTSAHTVSTTSLAR